MLIEMNPRPTQLTHLAFGDGLDLVAAFARAHAGLAVCDRVSEVTEGCAVAVFPLEMQRADGLMLRGAFHDVPWSEPAMMRRILGRIPVAIADDPRWMPESEPRPRLDPFRRPLEGRA